MLELSDGEEPATAAQALLKATDFGRDEGSRIVEREQRLFVFKATYTYYCRVYKHVQAMATGSYD